MKNIHILITDDHEVVREGLQKIIENRMFNIRVQQARDAEEALSKMQLQNFDILITDIKMPGMNGIELVEEVKKQKLDTEIIALTFLEQHHFIRQLIDLGVKYILLKSQEGGIWKAFDAMRDGEEYHSPEILKIIIEMRDEKPDQAGPVLTPREIEMLRHLAGDLSTKQAADKMHVAASTADSYRKSLRSKFKVNSIQGVVAKAYEYGILKKV
jgi:DNA-binding NarL/FixJ family response regulator